MNVRDVAEYVLSRLGPMTAMKLQKLVYYCQAWSLVWDERVLFDCRIEAWANGPVCPELYNLHRGRYSVQGGEFGGNINRLDQDALDTINGVLTYYGNKSAQWLSDLTHAESPWLDAREGVPAGSNCSNEITPAAMEEYYSAVPADA